MYLDESATEANDGSSWCNAFLYLQDALAVSGRLTPVIAAIAHTFATAVVIFNSARLVRFGEERASEIEDYIPGLATEPVPA